MTEPIMADLGPIAPRGRYRTRSLVLMMAALLVLGGACWTIWESVGDDIRTAVAEAQREWNKPKPPTPAEAAAVQEAEDNRPIGDGQAAYRSEVALFRESKDQPRPVVVFRRAAWTGWRDTGSLQGLITRELVRQGLILAIREGTDAVVRDRAAGDPDEAGEADATWRLGSSVQSSFNRPPDAPLGTRINLVAGSGATRRVIYKGRLDVISQEVPQYGQLVGRVERPIRDDLRGVPAEWKLPSSVAPQTPADFEALPAGVEVQLRSLSEVDQSAAIRALHDAIRQQGGSSTRRLALASRGYAMLGSLTEPLPSESHAVFKARALLYAQQAVAAEKDSPRSLRAQALVEALAGLTQEAKYDAGLANKADGGKKATPRDEAVQAFLALNPAALKPLAHRMADDRWHFTSGPSPRLGPWTGPARSTRYAATS